MNANKKLLILLTSVLIPGFIALKAKNLDINIFALLVAGFILPWLFYFMISSLKPKKQIKKKD